jgi:osmotically-inducible protein OsmY
MGRRINEGDYDHIKYGGVSRKTANTLGGVYQENRGRRSADETIAGRWNSSPFENGERYNWGNRNGWDQAYHQNQRRSRHGGGQVGPDSGHRGRGPKGYKRSDDSVFHDVCDTLALSAEVDASEIDVSVKEGVVYLNGSVTDRNTKKLAELQVENISGVSDVQNLLRINSKKDMH